MDRTSIHMELGQHTFRCPHRTVPACGRALRNRDRGGRCDGRWSRLRRPARPARGSPRGGGGGLAPSRPSSGTCMNRLSKTVSRMTDAPDAIVMSAMNCACMSVGKPGYGSVVRSTAFNGPERAIIRPRSVGQIHSGTFQDRSDRAKVLGEMGADDFKLTAGDRGRDGVGASLYAVGDQMVASLVEGSPPPPQGSGASRQTRCAPPSPTGRARDRRPQARALRSVSRFRRVRAWRP